MVQVSLMANNASKNNTVDINVGQTKNIVVNPKEVAKIDINPEKNFFNNKRRKQCNCSSKRWN